jgi:predicted SprT family Zn-dependent metalloprotease
LMPMSEKTNGNNHKELLSQPLPQTVRHEFEAKFGQDFSNVRVHENNQATLIGAEAFTQGNDIHFAPGKYHPNNESGQKLLAHELTHVVQQRTGSVSDVPQGMVESNNNDGNNNE